MVIPIFDSLLRIATPIIEGLFPDKEQQDKAKLAFLEMQQRGELKEIEAQMNILVAEAQSDHWLAATWRPITMLSFVAIIVNNYILYPYLQLVFGSGAMLQIPDNMWDLLKIGLGGYVIGRTVEKVAPQIRGKKDV